MTDIKRLNYYDHQFLHAEDFIDEQKYHLEMRRRHNQNLHTFGIVWGLDVKSESDGTVSVTAGEAIDSNGREMIFAGDRLQLKAAAEGAESYITITYTEVDSDRTEETGGAGFTRKTEKAIVAPSSTKPVEPSDFLTLAKLKRTGNAWVVVDPPERSQRAGVALGEDFTVKTLTLKKGNDPSKWPKLSCGDQGSLTISSAAIGTYAFIKNGKHEVLLGVDANSAILSTMTASDLEIRTNNTKRVVVQANTGNVGIGPATPKHSLSISSADETGAYASIKNGKHEVLLGVDANSAILSTMAASDLQIRTNNATRVVVQKDTGNVGIGSAAPSRAKLEVNGAVGNTVAVFGGDKTGMSLGVDYPFLGFNCYYKDKLFKAISKGRAGYSTVSQTDGSMSFCFDSTEKDVDANAALAPVAGFSIHPNGKLVSPMWKVTQVFQRKQGPVGGSDAKGLPSGDFSSGGGTLLFIFSGQAKAGGGSTGVQKIVLSLVGPSEKKMEFEYFSEYAQSHVIFPTCIRVLGGCKKGSYKINVENVYIDQNDFLDLVVIEFPF